MSTARTIIIGDVHGCVVELGELLDVVEPTAHDRIVFVGDLVDKGPDVIGVIRLARSLREQGIEVVLVQGNHEEKLARFRAAYNKKGEKGIRRFKGKAELLATTQALDDEDVKFLDSAVVCHKLPEHEAVVVHGGITSSVEVLDPEIRAIHGYLLRTRYVTGGVDTKVQVMFEGLDFDPAFGDGDGLTPDQVRELFEAMTITVQRKMVRPVGSYIVLGEETEDDPFWATVYDGRFGHVFFGHQPWIGAPEPQLFLHATGVDLGCVFGGRLAAAILEVGQPARFVSVEARAKYATSLWED